MWFGGWFNSLYIILIKLVFPILQCISIESRRLHLAPPLILVLSVISNIEILLRRKEKNQRIVVLISHQSVLKQKD